MKKMKKIIGKRLTRGANHVLGIILSAFWVLTHLIIKQHYEAATIIILMVGKEMEAERGQIACLRSQSL